MSRLFSHSRHRLAGIFFLVMSSAVQSRSQTIEEGLDIVSGLGPVTVKSEDLGGVQLGTGLWEYHTEITHDGTDSIRAQLPNRSTSSLTTSVEGPAIISFWWRISAQRTFDTLYFRTAGDVGFIQMPSDPQQAPTWEPRTFQVDTGTQPVEWFFQRYSSLPAGGTGEAWIDQFVVTPIPNNPALQGAVENFTHELHSTDWGSAPFDGALNSSVAKSGPVDPGGTSSMVFEIDGPATIAFDWGIASDPTDNSFLQFLVDNESYGSIEGNQDLHRRAFEVPPGTHQLKFAFVRDASSGDPFYAGPSEGYLDDLVITSFGENAQLADAIDLATGVFSNAWTRQTTTTHDGSDAASVSAPTSDVARRLYVKIPDGAGLLSFWTKTNVAPENALFRVLVDGTKVLERTDIGDWRKTEVNLSAGTGRLLEAILFRDPSSNPTISSAFFDEVVFLPGINNFQPDLSIGPRSQTPRGEGFFNASGAGQQAVVRARSRRPVGLYEIRASNGSSSDRDEIGLRGSWSDRDFEVLLVVREDGKRLNYTAAFKTGLFSTVELAPTESETHEIWVVRKPGSSSRSHSLRVTGRSTTSPAKIDVVKTRLTITK